MGWMADRWAETAERLQSAVGPHVGHEELLGCVHAMRQGRLSAKQFAIGVTPEHLVIVELDRKLQPVGGGPVKLRSSEITVGNLFSDGAALAVGRKGQEIRFTALGDEHRYSIMGGNVVENALAGDEQLDGLQALVEFLRSTTG